MTDKSKPNWYKTHDADGHYRDPWERWRQYDEDCKKGMIYAVSDLWAAQRQQLMSDLAALCEVMSENESEDFPERTAEQWRRCHMIGATNSDGSPRFPAKEQA